MSKEKDRKSMSGDPIYDECDDCGEMLVVLQCKRCRGWFCNRCWKDHHEACIREGGCQ